MKKILIPLFIYCQVNFCMEDKNPIINSCIESAAIIEQWYTTYIEPLSDTDSLRISIYLGLLEKTDLKNFEDYISQIKLSKDGENAFEKTKEISQECKISLIEFKKLIVFNKIGKELAIQKKSM